MKNVVIAFLALTTAVAGYFLLASNARVSLAALSGKKATLTRGDLTLPINATGEVRPALRVEIKSEASGEVIEVAKQPGDRVRAGETLIRLQPEDEQRNVHRAELKLTTSEVGLAEAKNLLAQAKGPDLDAAKAAVAQIQAKLVYTKMWADRVTSGQGSYTEDEIAQRTSSYNSELAQLTSVKASFDKAKLAIPRMEQAVQRAEATVESTQNDLADANKRLTKTDIVSPIDGIVATMNTQVGEVIQGGKSTFSVGTVLAVVLDMSRLVLRAEVDEADIGRVSELAPAWASPGHDPDEIMPDDLSSVIQAGTYRSTIKVETFPKEEFIGVIERIHPQPRNVQNVTTYLVDVVIYSANKSKLLSGMRGEVEFTSDYVKNVVLCPNDAIRRGPSGQLGVYIPAAGAGPDEPQTKFTPCEIGISDGAMTEIVSGVLEDAVVFTKLPAKTRSKKKRKKSEG